MNILSSFNLTKTQLDQFENYYKNLISYNEKVNLTAITEKTEVFIKHFFDSCLGAEFIPQNATVVDVGTGAGFPGLPLKILRPDIKLTLVDSLNKRIEFLKQLTFQLNILDCQLFHLRAEELARNKREAFDVVVSRAVANLSTLSEYCIPLLKIGGIFIAYKSGNYQDELTEGGNAINILGAKIEEIKEFDLPNNLGKRTIIVLKKIKSTPKQYPRNKNLPKLKPLK